MATWAPGLYAAADALAQAADEPRLFLLARYGVWAVHHVREEVGPALPVAEQMLDVASSGREPGLVMMAYRLLGTSQTMAGRLDEALGNFQGARELYDPLRDRALGLSTGVDPGLAIDCYRRWRSRRAAIQDRAHALTDEAWATSAAVEQLNARGYAFFHFGLTAAMGRASAKAAELGSGLVSLAGAHGLSFWEAMGGTLTAWGRLDAGDPEGCVAGLTRSLAAAQTVGSGLVGALLRSVLAEALARSGDDTAITVVKEAEALSRRTGALYGLAEIQRRRGVVLRWLRPDATVEAEAAFREAMTTARGQNARLFELRAACELVRLLAEQGRRQEAYDLLAPIHGWFTEGFGTPDLIEAKALLEELR